MNFFKHFTNVCVLLLAVFFIFTAFSCKSQPAAASGGNAGNAKSASNDGTFVVTGGPAILNLDFEDPSQPIPFTLHESSNVPACLMEYQDGKLHITNKVTGQTPWLHTNPILGKHVRDFFWQFEYTSNYNTWDGNMFIFRAVGTDMNSGYHIHFLSQSSLELRDKNSNLAQNNDNLQLHYIFGGKVVNGVFENNRVNIASTRLNWYTPGRVVMVRIVALEDNCKIWVWQKGRAMPDKPTFDFTVEIPELESGDFMIVSWDSSFMIDNMVIFDRAVP